VKQLLRAADSGFDERRYGFGGILDLLRASQRDALLRLERDRQGVLRVFAGSALQRPASAPPVQEATIAEPAPGSEGCEQVEPRVADAAAAVEPADVVAATPEAGAPAVIDAESIDVGDAQPETAADGAASPEAKPRRRRGSSGARKTAPAKKPRATAPKSRGRKKESE
jgi:hypothetical protein